MAEWWRKNNKKIPLHLKEFQRIVAFFVYQCPVQYKDGRKVTPRAVSFEEKNIIAAKQTSLLNSMKSKIEHKECYKPCNSMQDIMEFEKSCRKKYPAENHVEFIAYIPDPELEKTRTIFYSLRNSLAHGSFSFVDSKNGERFYYFEAAKGNNIKARYCLSERTLMKWIQITEEVLS